MAPWFDTHVHLDRYSLPERGVLLKRARAAEVAVLVVATDLASSREVSALGGVRGKAVGVHPRNAGPRFEDELRELAKAPGVFGIGECGFDGAGPSWGEQEATFLAQCEIARDLRKALVLHVDGEGAWERLLGCEQALAGLRVVRHYFTGDVAQAGWHREHGHYLSFGNPLRREASLREIARDYPSDLLLIETDSYPLPGRTTEPAGVVRVGMALAEVHGWTEAETRARLAANTLAVFGG